MFSRNVSAFPWNLLMAGYAESGQFEDSIAKFLCLLHVTNNYLFSSSLVYGPSMLPTLNLTKRVVAMEGDKVTFFTDPTATHFSPAVEVPKGHVWVQGDNLYASHDSRHFGPVPYALIQGKVFLRVWYGHLIALDHWGVEYNKFCKYKAHTDTLERIVADLNTKHADLTTLIDRNLQ